MPERRKLPRYVLGSSGKLMGAASFPENVSVLVLSLEGALISCSNPPQIGQKVTLKIEVEGSEVELQAEVRSREKTGSAGVMFLQVDDQTRERLKKICTGRPLARSSRPQGGR